MLITPVARYYLLRNERPLLVWLGCFIGIGATWRIVAISGWWTIGAFLGVALVAGIIQAHAKYKLWEPILFSLGRQLAIGGTLLTIASWRV